jgi:DnaJ-domain-containing protein 1
LAGLAFDQWKKFVLHLKSRPPSFQTVSHHAALMLAVVGYARGLDLPKLTMPSEAIRILRGCFVAAEDALRYAGKVMRAEPPPASEMAMQAQTIRKMCGDDTDLKKSVMVCLAQLAAAKDGAVDRVSHKALHEMAIVLGLAQDDIARIFSVLPAVSDDPHAVLGITPNTGFARITEAYRDLIRQTHPDRWGSVKNPYTRARLQDRAARINAAYDHLKKAK